MLVLPVMLILATAATTPRRQIDVMGNDAFISTVFADVHRQLAADMALCLQPEERIVEIAFGAPYLAIALAKVLA